MDKGTLLDILKQIELGQIRPEEGYASIKSMKSILYYDTEWIERRIEIGRNDKGDNIIIIDTGVEIYNTIKKLIPDKSEKVILVRPGKEYKQIGDTRYEINLEDKGDYELLLKDLKEKGIRNCRVIHTLTNKEFTYDTDKIKEQLDEGFYFLLKFAQAFSKINPENSLKIVCLYSGEQPFNRALGAFSRSVNFEKPEYLFKTVEVDEKILKGNDKLCQIILDELKDGRDDFEIRYIDDIRMIKSPKQVYLDIQNEEGPILKDKGIYLITGGLGGLGLNFAKYLSSKYEARLALIGRSPINEEKREELRIMRESGAEVLYVEADISHKEQINMAIREIISTYGKIDGVIHGAGIIKDDFFINKTLSELEMVLSPKIMGTLNLIEELGQYKLDFFVMFSSLAAVTGNIGQCDYAYANSFMDNIANNCKQLLKADRVVSINWPLWEDGGMKVDQQTLKMFKSKMGIVPLDTDTGIRTFHAALNIKGNQLGVLKGDREKITEILSSAEEREKKIDESINLAPSMEGIELDDDTDNELQLKVEELLINIFSEVVKIPVNKVDRRETFDKYGVDSIVVLGINEKLEEIFGELPKTLLFQYQSIAELAKYFLQNHKKKAAEKFMANNKTNFHKPKTAVKTKTNLQKHKPKNLNIKSFKNNHVEKTALKESLGDDIAVIGIHGRYPYADDLEEFWENLKNGRDCISEVPKDRWDISEYYTEDKNDLGMSYTKWGGFLKDIDKFDPLFFNISPREAEFLDPQERLFLESCWLAIENGNYTREMLRGKKVGVYVGVMYGEHQLYEADVEGKPLALSASYASIANRVSYCFGFHGPSIALDTMCSSSLSSIHLACESLRRGECELALAGGVNLSLHPNKYRFLSQQRFASSDGRCRAFGEGGDGYVPGEGVGVLLLKPLKKAISDKDHIYAVIKGTAINHGGRTSGYTVPNPNAQRAVILEALEKSNIDPSTIGYIEAHGTGTALGDPIEIAGITEAFKKYTDNRQFCPIGSVKSNIGHAESAAGIAGVTKVILQMKHKQLVPSIHSTTLNPNINFEETPFYVQQELTEWKQKEIFENGKKYRYPRRAGVSSFGAGGANAHIILEEYIDEEKLDINDDLDDKVIVLSAKNRDRLEEYVANILKFLKGNNRNKVDADLKDKIIDQVKKDTIESICKYTGLHASQINEEDSLDEYGIDAIGLIEISKGLSEKYNIEIDASILMLDGSIKEIVEEIFTLIKQDKSSQYNELVEDGNYIIDEINFANFTYTLQTGREEMPERLAFLASSFEELIEKLESFLNGKSGHKNIYTGNVESGRNGIGAIIDEEEAEELVQSIIRRGKLEKLCQLWTAGVKIDWALLYENYNDNLPVKIPLPNVPMMKQSYRIKKYVRQQMDKSDKSINVLHPFVHTNTSTLKEHKYTTTVSNNDNYFEEYTFRGKKLISIGAMLEMIMASSEIAAENKIKLLENVKLGGRIYLGEQDVQMHTLLHTDYDNSTLACELFTSEGSNKRRIYLQADITLNSKDEASKKERINIEELKKGKSIDISSFYDYCFAKDVVYPERDRNMKAFYKKANKGFAIINNREASRPALFNHVMQAIGCFLREEGLDNAVDNHLYSVKKIQFLSDLEPEYYIHIEYLDWSNYSKIFDVTVTDASGTIIMKMNEVIVKEFLLAEEDSIGRIYFTPSWEEIKDENLQNNINTINNVLMLSDRLEIYNSFKEQLRRINSNISTALAMRGEKFEIQDEDIFKVKTSSNDSFAELLAKLEERGNNPDYIIYLWGLDNPQRDNYEAKLDLGVNSLLSLSQALANQKNRKKTCILYPYMTNRGDNNAFGAAMIGFAKTIKLEDPRILIKCMDIDVKEESHYRDVLNTIIKELNYGFDDKNAIKYKGESRFVEKFSLVSDLETTNTSFKKDGVYIIVGGAGGLGKIVASYLVDKYSARLVLTGRSELNPKITQFIDELNKRGGKVEYVRCDVANKDDVQEMVSFTKDKFGHINGVIHAAGINKDAYFIKKTPQEMKDVLRPKILGTLNLDECTKDEKLDHFILFSSIAAVNGNLGQCDYAYANRFMDAFAQNRARLTEEGIRSGATISINWPLWSKGGMHISKEDERLVLEQTGFMALPTQEGIKALEDSISLTENRIIVGYGKKDKISQIILSDIKGSNEIEELDEEIDMDDLLEKTEAYLKKLFGELLKINTEEIDSTVTFQDYGIDSNMINYFNAEIEKDISNLPKTLLFEFQTIKELAEHLVEEYKSEFISLLYKRDKKGRKTREDKTKDNKINQITLHDRTKLVWEELKSYKKEKSKTSLKATKRVRDIAIIGVSGRYPKANDISQFWDNLLQARDCITEIPKDRWDYREYFDEDYINIKEGKMYCKWGGFVHDVDKFDPLFFKISPAEAEIMDPQERLFIETAWRLMEDAGYAPRQSGAYKRNNRNIGVFVGITTNSYQLWGPEEWLKGNYVVPNSVNWSIANRISYLFNLNGPSIPVDTACSSSLTAVHLACESIRNNECEMAIAGGVNLYLHPYKYVSMCQLRMLSPTGRCHTFSEEGDGFVPGEGVGAILLKPLEKAIEDRDQIYGVIKGSSLNHGGSTNGYTVPSQTAQTEVILDAIKKAGVNPRTISYIEAHGTGTKLGDPIEIAALTKAFKGYTDEKEFCSIGSIKTNIGHLESAAGIAGITKILCQMKHKKLVPSLHAKNLNPNIPFKETPFVVQQRVSDWEAPVVNIGGEERQYPRIAGISSFGAGGSNNHIIIEEYLGDEGDTDDIMSNALILSTKDEETLKILAKDMLDYFNNNDKTYIERKLNGIAYTLQTGREHMEERLAILYESYDDIIDGLQNYISGKTTPNMFTNNIRDNKSKGELEEDDIEPKDLDKLVKLWVEGKEIDWEKLYEDNKPIKVSLPGYPFKRQSYWVKRVAETKQFNFKSQSTESLENSPIEVEYYAPEWTESQIDNENLYSLKEDRRGKKVLIVCTESTYDLDKVIENMHQGSDIHRIVLTKNHQRKYTSNFQEVNAFDSNALIEAVKEIDGIDIVYFLGLQKERYNLNDPAGLNDKIEFGILSLFRLMKGLTEGKNHSKDMVLKVITNNVHEVIKGEGINGFAGGVNGFARTIAKEFPDMRVSCMDIDIEEIIHNPEEIAKQILLEPQHKKDEEIAFRGYKRYSRLLVKKELASNQSIFKRNGSYLIVGGLGNIGFSLAKHLAEKYNANLIITGKSDLDASRRNKIERLETMGGQVLYMKSNLDKLTEMQETVKQGIARFGHIDGVIHSAMGPVLPELIVDMDEQSLKDTILPKTVGSLSLYNAIKDIKIDFMLFMSSGQSFTGNPYRSHYAAACCFKDVYANALRMENKFKVKTINWGFWGTVDEKPLEAEYRKMIEDNGAIPIEPEEGLKAMEMILSSQEDQIFTMKVKDYVLKLMNVVRDDANLSSNESSYTKHNRQTRREYETNKESDKENIIKAVKKEVLESMEEILQIQRDDMDLDIPFMDFGMDSILAARVVNAINERLSIDLSVTNLFDYSTTNRLIDYIAAEYEDDIASGLADDNMQKINPVVDEIEEVFRKLQKREIDIEEANEILEGLGDD